MSKQRTFDIVMSEIQDLKRSYIFLERHGDISNLDPKDALSKTNPIAYEAFRLHFIKLHNEIVAIQSKIKHGKSNVNRVGDIVRVTNYDTDQNTFLISGGSDEKHDRICVFETGRVFTESFHTSDLVADVDASYYKEILDWVANNKKIELYHAPINRWKAIDNFSVLKLIAGREFPSYFRLYEKSDEEILKEMTLVLDEIKEIVDGYFRHNDDNSSEIINDLKLLIDDFYRKK